MSNPVNMNLSLSILDTVSVSEIPFRILSTQEAVHSGRELFNRNIRRMIYLSDIIIENLQNWP